MEQPEFVNKTKNWKSYAKWLLGAGIFIFIGLNLLAAFHAYNFTHFNDKDLSNSINHSSSSFQKLNSILFGSHIQKPLNDNVDLDFIEVDTIKAEVNLEVWRLDMEPSKGVVALFHGYKASKSSLWSEAQAFYRMGFTVVLVDFRASGNSDGNVCSLGYYEANDVLATYQYCLDKFPKQKIFLYGSSMGAAAIMRAVSELHIEPQGVLLQSPFYTMLSAVQTRFNLMKIPSFPAAQLITFWGGWLNDFNAYSHNPIGYASNIMCPTLLIHGMLDDRVTLENAKAIYNVLPGKKELGIFSKSGHESILNKEEPNWIYLVTNFMESNLH